MVYDSSTSLAKLYVNGAPAVSYNQQDTTPAPNTLSTMTNTWVGRSVQSPTSNNMKFWDQGGALLWVWVVVWYADRASCGCCYERCDVVGAHGYRRAMHSVPHTG